MHSSKISISLVFLSIALVACASDVKGTSYVNERSGYVITIPTGWVVNDMNDVQSFWENADCAIGKNRPCNMFIKSVDNPNHNADEIWESAQKSNAHPVWIKTSSPDVEILSSDVLNPGESGYKYRYHVFFNGHAPEQTPVSLILSNTREFDEFIGTIHQTSDPYES